LDSGAVEELSEGEQGAEWPSLDPVCTISPTFASPAGESARGILFYEDPPAMPKVSFVNEKREIEVPDGANLRLEAQKAGIDIYRGIDRFLNCRGNGLCGTCRVLVKKGMENLTPKGFLERFKLGTMLSSIGHEDEMRLACQVRVHGDCSVVTRPPMNLSGENFWQKPYPNK
jgi:ferredoxin